MIYNLKAGGLHNTTNKGELILDNLSTIGMELIEYFLIE
jgi:hypothetical protein